MCAESISTCWTSPCCCRLRPLFPSMWSNTSPQTHPSKPAGKGFFMLMCSKTGHEDD
jgi:hypothetical protein